MHALVIQAPVIPRKAGIQTDSEHPTGADWTPACAGATN